MADFDAAYAPLEAFEGGYSDDPSDRGGETWGGCARNFFPKWAGWGIIDAAKSHQSFRRGSRAFNEYLATLPELKACLRDWYREEWWNRLGLGALPQNLANEIFEQSVNLGKGGAGKKIQQMCNAFNYDKSAKGPLFADLKVDGAVGPKTLGAMAVLLARRTDEDKLVHALNCLQGAHYIELAAGKPSQRKYTDGWMKRTHCPGENQ